ncbi:cation:dicarboxylase symporter family transporter, partial [Acinetobacter baumannii]
SPLLDLVGRIPKDLLSPFVSNDMVGVILIAIALGVSIRTLRTGEHATRVESIAGYVKLGKDVTLRMLHWVFELIPFAVLAVIAAMVGKGG